jgi:hypothetical protein
MRELRHVSLPKLKSVPGTLLLIVAGKQTMGILKAGYLSLPFLISQSAEKASNPPIIINASNLCF